MSYQRFVDSPDTSSIGSVCGSSSDQHQDETQTTTDVADILHPTCSRSVCGSTSSRSTNPNISFNSSMFFSSITHAKNNTWKKTIAIDTAVYALVIAYFSLWGYILVTNCVVARPNYSHGDPSESAVSDEPPPDFTDHGHIAERYPFILGASQVMLLSILALWLLRIIIRYVTIQFLRHRPIPKHSASSTFECGCSLVRRVIGQLCCFCCCHECLLCFEKSRKRDQDKQNEQAAYHMFVNTNTLHTLDTDADVF